MEKIDFCIIGGGVVGLLTAREILLNNSEASVAILEKNPFLGEESSARNSGVMHAGLYYPFQSQKHLLCLEGKKLWESLAPELNISVDWCGKWIVASNQETEQFIDGLFETAQKNGVEGLRWGEKSELEEIAPFVDVRRAFLSPKTGILSPSEVIRSLDREVHRLGAMILSKQKLIDLKKVQDGLVVTSTDDEFLADTVINCAGGFAPMVRNLLDLNDVESVWVKGCYLKLNKPFYNKRLIYPVPPKDLKGLGVHTSFDLDRVIRFGPNTIDVESYEMSVPETLIDEMYPAIAELFPTIKKTDLSLDYCGIRSKIKKDGKIFTDFLIQSPIKNYVEALGIESPGLTASPAIAKKILKIIKEQGRANAQDH